MKTSGTYHVGAFETHGKCDQVKGDTAVNRQLGLIERRIGRGIVRFPFAFAFSKRVSEALALIGGRMNDGIKALADTRVYRSVVVLVRGSRVSR